MTMSGPGRGIRLVAGAALIVEIAIHAYLAPDHLEEIPYIGVGFVVAAALGTAVLVGVVFAPRRAAVWRTGALLCLGMAAAFVASRTVGLPSFHETWTSDSGLGLVALPPELAFLWCARPLLGRGTAFERLHPCPPPSWLPATSPRSGIRSRSTLSGPATNRW
jgi:hypothetical protein